MQEIAKMVVLKCYEKCVLQTPKGPDNYTPGEFLELTEEDFQKEIALGKHPRTGRWMSGAISHFEFLDGSDDMRKLVRENATPPPPEPVKHVINARRGRPKKEK